MKKRVTIIILLLIVVCFGGAMYYLYQKNAEDPITYETEKPSTQTIIKKTVATGSILPLEEVLPILRDGVVVFALDVGEVLPWVEMLSKLRDEMVVILSTSS